MAEDDKKVEGDDKKNINWEAIAKERIESLEKYRVKNADLETRLSTIEAERATTVEKLKLETEEKERASLVEKGKFQEALKLEQDKFTRERDGLITTVHGAVIPATIKVALTKIPNLVPTAIDDVTEQLQGKLGIDPKTMKAFVRGPDGKPLAGADGTPMAPDVFIADFVAKRSYLKVDGMATGAGVGAGSKGAAGDVSGQAYTAENALASRALANEWQAKDPAGFKAAMDLHQKAQRRALRKV